MWLKITGRVLLAFLAKGFIMFLGWKVRETRKKGSYMTNQTKISPLWLKEIEIIANRIIRITDYQEELIDIFSELVMMSKMEKNIGQIELVKEFQAKFNQLLRVQQSLIHRMEELTRTLDDSYGGKIVDN